MTTFVVADTHGNLDLLAGLLKHAGILDDGLDRVGRGEIRTVHLGDLCNCVISSVSDDHRCIDHVEDWFDVYLVGNHEHPYFGGPAFNGFYRDLVLHHKLLTLNATGLIQPCLTVDGILLSHAGLAIEWAGKFGSAEQVEADLRRWWREDPAATPIFSAIGRVRGGWTDLGGVLWSDWHEPKAQHLKQIFGHTPAGNVRRLDYDEGGWEICLDLGGGKGSSRLAGAFIRDGEVEIVEFDSTEAAAA